MSMNFGYNFGRDEEGIDGEEVQKSENITFGNQQSQTGGQSQTSDFSIDLNQITPPTFRFGQFGQAPLPSDSGINDNNEDDDSFLAEPSITAGQFDSTFNFKNEFASSNSVDSLENAQAPSFSISSKSSHSSVPVLVEELVEQPVYLEEPAPHSVEELLKATIDGDTTAVMGESWENVGIEEIEAAEAELSKAETIENLQSESSETTKSPESSQVIESEKSESEPEAIFSKMAEYETDVDKSEKLVEVQDEPKTIKAMESKAKPSSAKIVKAKAEPKSKALKPAKTVKAKVEPETSESEPKRERRFTDLAANVSPGRSKRERKTVERLADVVLKPKPESTDKATKVFEGKGVKLGDIEHISHNLNRKVSSDKNIIMLHRLVFDRMGEARRRKADLRAYCGREGANFVAKLQKYTKKELIELSSFLGLTCPNEKTALATRISDFLVKPTKEAAKAILRAERAVEKKAKKASVAAKKAKKKATFKSLRKKSSELEIPPKKGVTYSSPEFIDSDVESEVEREVLQDLKTHS